jgi:hypothetical protein
MSDVRVKTWPLAVAGSMMLHATVLTGLYAVPTSGDAGGSGKGGVASASVLTNDTTPIYLIPDELPSDVAARLEKERAAAAKNESVAPAVEPKVEPELAAKPAPKPMEPIPVPLGKVDGAKITTTSWLSNDAKGENGGIQSEVDQPQLDLKAMPSPQGDPGEGGQDGKNGEKATPMQPDPLRAPSADDPTKADQQAPMGPPAPARAEVKAEPAVEPSIGPEAPKSELPVGPSQPEIKAGNSGGETPAKTQPATAPPAQPAPVDGKPAVEGTPGSKPMSPAATPVPSSEAPGAAGSPGVPMANKTVAADRDADAASIKRSAVFRNGKVEAGEGLDIKTVRPKFNTATQALIQPGSPTLEIIFGKDGRAKRVRVLRSSGYPQEVDSPVVTALYNWRAKGRLLDELPPRPDSSVALEITILLH